MTITINRDPVDAQDRSCQGLTLFAAPLRVEPDRVCTRCNELKPAAAFHWTYERRRSICASCCSKRESLRAPRPPEQKLRNKLLREYGITLEQYESMLAAQGGACAMCGVPPSDCTRLSVDHCHESGRVRALLCRACNTLLGSYEKVRVQAGAYLARYGDGSPLLNVRTGPGLSHHPTTEDDA